MIKNKEYDEEFLKIMEEIKMPINILIEAGIIEYRPEKCDKSSCKCIEIAEIKNGGNPVKSYECLAKVDDLNKTKT